MSFLDQLKNKNKPAGETAAPAAAKPNPLAGGAKPNPLAAKPNPLAPKTAAPAAETAAPAIEESGDIPSSAPEKKTLSFLQKKDGATDPFGKPSAAVVPPAAESAQPASEEPTSPATADASASESLSADNIVADMKEADAAAQAAEPAAQVEEKAADPGPEAPATKPAKGGTRGGKGAAKDKPQAPKAAATTGEETENVYVDSPTTRVSYGEAMEAIRSGFVDPEWETFQESVEEQLTAIEIADDMNAGTLKAAIASLSKLRQTIWSPFQSTKSTFEMLSSKEPEGLIERIKKISLGDGTNDLQRKKAGVEACLNYVDPRSGTHINLYEFLDETRMRYNFLKSTMDSIQYKTNVLITMSGALKLENAHVGSET